MKESAAAPSPDKGIYVFASGRKGSGKSVICRAWFDAYPYDRVVVDPTHDVAKDLRRDGVDFTELRGGLDLPARLPEYRPGHPQTYVFCPDMGAESADDDMDRVVGLALGREQPTCVWCDEFGAQTSAHKTPPNMRRLLHHGRHDHVTALFACPRPVDINGLAISQADLVYTFRTANPDDLERIAKNIGWNPAEFEDINAGLDDRGAHWHTKYVQATGELWIMPPLPIKRRGRIPVGEPGELADAAAADELAAAARHARR